MMVSPADDLEAAGQIELYRIKATMTSIDQPGHNKKVRIMRKTALHLLVSLAFACATICQTKAFASTSADVFVTRSSGIVLTDLDLNDGIAAGFTTGPSGGISILNLFSRDYTPAFLNFNSGNVELANTPTHVSGSSLGLDSYFVSSKPLLGGLYAPFTITPHTAFSFSMGVAMSAWIFDDAATFPPLSGNEPQSNANAVLRAVAITNIVPRAPGDSGGDPYDGSHYGYKFFEDSKSIHVGLETTPQANLTGELTLNFENQTDKPATIAFMAVATISGSDSNVSPVPEIGTWAMMAAGLGFLGAVARRRRPD